MYTENTQNAQKVEYLGKFGTKIENILGLYQEPRRVCLAKSLKTSVSLTRKCKIHSQQGTAKI
jgi:hypothetical protein